MRQLCTSLLSLMLLASLAAYAQTVGASLTLEGHAAVTRAVQVILEKQQPDGTWHGDLPLTSLAADALRAANDCLQNDACNLAMDKAIKALQPNIPSLKGSQKAIAMRLLLLSPRQLSTSTAYDDILASALDELVAFRPPDTSSALWTADAIALAARRLRRPLTASWFEGLANFPQDSPESNTPALRLALAIAAGNSTPNALKTLYSSARNTTAATCPIPSLYWSARAFQACNDTRLVPNDNWQADILSALLERQRGNGTWQTPGSPPQEALGDTALAIHTIILCLKN